MKRITALLLFGLLWTAYVMAQSSMTDRQVMDYVMEENAKGTSRQQIVTQLMQHGVTMDQMRRNAYDGQDEEFAAMSDALDFMMPDCGTHQKEEETVS